MFSYNSTKSQTLEPNGLQPFTVGKKTRSKMPVFITT